MSNSVERQTLPVVGLPRRRPGGFTLLEVLLALALLAILLGSVLSAVRWYGELATLGRDQVQRQRVLAALERRLRQDLQSTLLPEPDSANQGPSAPQTGGEETPSAQEQSTLATITGQEAIWGLVGDATSLVLVVRRPVQELLLTADTASEETAPLLGDLRLVGYLVAGTQGDELGALVAQQAAQNQGATQPAAGFARWELPWAQGQQMLQQQDLASVAASAQVLAPEVTAVAFRYFDGSQWLESWDSSAQGALPLAVEVTLWLVPAAGEEPQQTALSSDSGEETVRLVVYLPGASSSAAPTAGDSAP